MDYFILRNSEEKENASLAQAPQNEVGMDPVEVMDISAKAMEEVVEMAEDSVEDIDADDAGNPQLVIEYVNDIYCYLRYVLIIVNISSNSFNFIPRFSHLETVQCIEADYLAGQTEILPKMRAVLIGQLIFIFFVNFNSKTLNL